MLAPSVMLVLASLPASPSSADLASPSYAVRESATVRMVARGHRSACLARVLMASPDAEVRHRARLVFEAVAYPVTMPGEPFPGCWSLMKPVRSLDLPAWLTTPIENAAGRPIQARCNLDPRACGEFAMGWMDELVRCGLPARWAQAWVDEAVRIERGLRADERRASVAARRQREKEANP